jgi:hypothetical protein
MPSRENNEQGETSGETSRRTGAAEAEFRLQKLTYDHADFINYHRWPYESERWVELAFALLTQVSELPEIQVREAAEKLEANGLIEIEDLARQSPEERRAQMERSVEVLEEEGFSPEEAQRGITSIWDAASTFEERYGGKVQVYLRQYGERMLDEVQDEFSFTELESGQVDYAFRYWLQNVLNMPVNLPLDSVDALAEECGITTEELVQAADNLDLNVALMDDIVQQAEQK